MERVFGLQERVTIGYYLLIYLFMGYISHKIPGQLTRLTCYSRINDHEGGRRKA